MTTNEVPEDSEEKVIKLLRNGYCNRHHCDGKGIAEDSHTCPFAEEIRDDHDSECNCCKECTYQCAMDI